MPQLLVLGPEIWGVVGEGSAVLQSDIGAEIITNTILERFLVIIIVLHIGIWEVPYYNYSIIGIWEVPYYNYSIIGIWGSGV